MDNEEARQLLLAQVEVFRSMPYAALARLVGTEPLAEELAGPSGTEYFAYIQIFWDDKPDGNVRVIGHIYDYDGVSQYSPFCEDFIISSTGLFVGEDFDCSTDHPVRGQERGTD